jgi:1-acyl-sn-glycerol-3-phosphate acyltransferase
LRIVQRRGSVLRGIATITLMALNVMFWVPVLMVVAVARLLVPLPGWRAWSGRLMSSIAEVWISNNCTIFRWLGVLQLDVRGGEELDPREWYLVISNHRSWVDILVLQQAFNRRIPLLKFFLKRQLIWVPFLGLAWWALEFPFMRRHSSAYLAAHPEARGQDLAATRKACERFARIPTSVMNFVEGTRFTAAKHAKLASSYRNLLPPRAGGVAFVLAAMGGILQSMLDVTIAYRAPSPTLWDLCCGRLAPVTMVVERRAIEPWTTAGDYTEDEAFRRRFQAWLSGIWADKDRTLDRLLPR